MAYEAKVLNLSAKIRYKLLLTEIDLEFKCKYKVKIIINGD
jgi:hypothetical protein